MRGPIREVLGSASFVPQTRARRVRGTGKASWAEGGRRRDEIRRRGHPRARKCLQVAEFGCGRPIQVGSFVGSRHAALVVNRPRIGTSDDGTRIATDARFLEGAILVGHAEAIDLLYRRLAECAALTLGLRVPTCLGRHLGAAAAFLGKPEKARTYYETALNVAGEMRFRPEIALTRLQLAELQLEHFPEERDAALEHLEFASGEFQEMKMQPSLERALSLRNIR